MPFMSGELAVVSEAARSFHTIFHYASMLTTNHSLSTTHHSPLTTHHSLFTTHYLIHSGRLKHIDIQFAVVRDIHRL